MSHVDNKIPPKDAGTDQLRQGVEKAKQQFEKSRQEQNQPKRGRPPGSGKAKR